MNKSIRYCFTLVVVALLLSGCQNNDSILPPVPVAIKEVQNEVIEKCLALNNTEPHEKLAYLYEQFNDVDKSGWYMVKDVAEDEGVFRGLSKWSGDGLKRIVLEDSTPSGDWFRIDDYCFNRDDNIARLYSDLRTFYGDVQSIRTWEYYSDGSIKNSNTELIDLKTEESINPDEANYMDNPPQLVKNFEELAKSLELTLEN